MIQGNTHSITISLPTELVKKLDRDRGDISRSRFILRIVEKYFEGKNQ